MHYQSPPDSGGALVAGGLTLSQDKSTCYFAATDEGEAICRIFESRIGEDQADDATRLIQQQSSACFFLERHYTNLIWMGYDSDGGMVSLLDMRGGDNARNRKIPLGQGETPVALASSLEQKAVFVASQQVLQNDNELGVGDVFGGVTTVPPLPFTSSPWEMTARRFWPQVPLEQATQTQSSAGSWNLVVRRFDSTMNPVWDVTFKARTIADDTSPQIDVFASGLVAFPSYLIAVGSTAGYGPAFGAGQGSDVDGFFAKLSYADGQLLNLDTNTNTHRFGSEGDDWILNLCYQVNSQDQEGDDELKPETNFFYIVGATNNALQHQNDNPRASWRGFVAKINIDTFREEWIAQFPADFENWVTHCRVDNNNGAVYVTGVVSGGPLVASTTPYGQQDVFVARINEGGTIQWSKQVGTVGNERPAGIDLGNMNQIVVYGETTGSMFQDNPTGTSQLVLWSMNADSGALDDPIMGEAPTDSPTTEPISTPTFPANEEDIGEDDHVEESFGDDEEDDDVVLPDDIDPDLEEPPPEEEWTNDLEDESFSSSSHTSLVSKVSSKSSGFQSDMGPTYAGSMVYDFDRHSVYLTGSSYGHVGHRHDDGSFAKRTAHCFLTHLRMVRYEWAHLSSADEEEEDMVQSCNTIAQRSNHLYLAGMEVSDPKKSLYSILSHLQRTRDQPNWTPISNNWLQADNFPIGYPVSMVADQTATDNSIFVVGLQSTDTRSNIGFATFEDLEHPNLTPGGHIKYGNDFQVTIQHYHESNDPSQDKLVQNWEAVIKNSANGDGSFVAVSGVAMLGDTVFVVGSVKGDLTGVAFSDAAATHTGVDGWIFPVRAIDGLDSKRGKRFDSGADDWIYNICVSSSSTAFFYIVGATTGRIDTTGSLQKNHDPFAIDAFVTKFDSSTLEPVWTRQLGTTDSITSSADSPRKAAAYGCAIVPHDDVLYVAGVVENGAVVDFVPNPPKSSGSDDIFVAQLGMEDGDIKWLRQVGSAGKENLARSGGIVADMDGHAIVYGDTTGELFRVRTAGDTSDIFVMTLDKADGSYAPTVETIKFEFWMALAIAFTLLGLTCCCCVYRRKRRAHTDTPSKKYFPEEDNFHDEEETFVAGRREIEMTSEPGKQNSNKSLSKGVKYDDFMPRYYKDNPEASRPGRNIV